MFQEAVLDNVDTARDEGQDSGPHRYYWDDRDTFTVGGSRVTLEQFEAIVDGGTKANPVTITTIEWEDYDYHVYNDRARWIVEASCTQGVQ